MVRRSPRCKPLRNTPLSAVTVMLGPALSSAGRGRSPAPHRHPGQPSTVCSSERGRAGRPMKEARSTQWPRQSEVPASHGSSYRPPYQKSTASPLPTLRRCPAAGSSLVSPNHQRIPERRDVLLREETPWPVTGHGPNPIPFFARRNEKATVVPRDVRGPFSSIARLLPSTSKSISVRVSVLRAWPTWMILAPPGNFRATFTT
jgi:hypothetical protein